MPEPMLWSEAELGHGRELPQPEGARFQPLRAGILNLWQYDEQEFHFAGGRLILRGANGSGKSKALELLLPFLLDADLSPRRLDPFTAGGRSMDWNLLEGGRHRTRLGYVWLEFGALSRQGDGTSVPTFVTLGCGLRGSEQAKRVDAWYFVTSARVGEGLFLTSHRAALTREQLRQALGERGTVFDVAKEYRERVDALLYGLGAEGFEALRELLLKLRRPHLSEKLNPDELSKLVSESLPPIDLDLVSQVAEGFERLDRDEAEVKRIEKAGQAVAAFLEVYRSYARGIGRVRAQEVRQADSRYHRTAGEVRQAEAEHLERSAELARCAAAADAADAALVHCRAAVRALEGSEGMRQAEVLREKGKHAASLGRQSEQDQQAREREAGDARTREREAKAAEERFTRARERLREGGRRAHERAQPVALAAVHAEVEALAHSSPEQALRFGEAAINERERGAEELSALVRARTEAGRQLELARRTEQAADAQARAAAERKVAAEARTEAERRALRQALESWLEGLTELVPSAEELSELSLRVGSEGGEVGDLAGYLTELATNRREALVEARTQLDGEMEILARTVAELAAQRAALEAARELGPEPPRTRAAARESRPGAPLYLLCDFAPGLPPAARAGLEAALEAAGLLDAWVSPGGRLLASGTLDTLLTASPYPDGETLADWLVPNADHGVEEEVVRQILRSVAVGDRDEGRGRAHRVAIDGSFRLGPLSGTWAKGEAEHIGASARAAARQRRLSELARRRDELALAQAELERRRRDLETRRARLEEERRRAPEAKALVRALAEADAALSDQRRRLAELAEAEAATARAEKDLEGARSRLEERARALTLAAFVDDLGGFQRLLGEYRHALGAFALAAAAEREAAGDAAAAEEHLATARSRLEEAAARAAASQREATAAAAELETLEATVGQEVAELLARLAGEQAKERKLGAELDRLRRAHQEELIHLARLEERRARFETELVERDAARGRAVERFRRLADRGFLSLALPASILDGAPAWNITRALELARALETETVDVELSDAAASRRANRMHGQYQELTAELGGDYVPSLEQEEELQAVRILHNNQAHDVPALGAKLAEEAQARRELLRGEERQLLRKFLAGEVGDHLHRRLRQARELVERMNEKLKEVPTASGMQLKLDWQPDEEALPEVRSAVKLLTEERALLPDAALGQLEAFFAGRIEAARREWEAVPWREYLGRALDYRLWHRFLIKRRMAGEAGWLELTSRRHAASSGGEKAVALHLPLFAAASAHYESARPTAPRLIVLDEAFAGIDEGMRGRLMGLLVRFDLDFMMTSYDEWGTYAELPSVAVYQLYRDPEQPGVAAVRFVWNGTELAAEGEP